MTQPLPIRRTVVTVVRSGPGYCASVHDRVSRGDSPAHSPFPVRPPTLTRVSSRSGSLCAVRGWLLVRFTVAAILRGDLRFVKMTESGTAIA